MKAANRDIIKVQVRCNNGDDTVFQPTTITEALDIAERERNSGNYMVCIAIDEERTHRWDREFAVNKNRWRKREPGAREPKGRIPRIYHDNESFFSALARKEDGIVGLDHRICVTAFVE